MKHIVVTYEAIRSLASQRRWQSIDFEDCAKLVEFIIGDGSDFESDNIFCFSKQEGKYIFSSRLDSKKSVVFDLQHFELFDKDKKDHNKVITGFQKTIKLAIKLFEDINLSKSERMHISNSKKIAIVYPFSFTFDSNENYEIAIDTVPDSKRTEKRNQKHLLVFGSGPNARNKGISFTVFRKAIKNLEEICHTYRPKSVSDPKVKSLRVEKLNESTISTKKDSTMDPQSWKYHLTKNQKEFIDKKVDGPQRLEGAAGTGKTLSLVLKASKIIKSAVENDKAINIIFISHSTSTRNSTFSIFQSNIPHIERYLNKNQSKVSIEIQTLQEWCIKYLGTGIASTEYLDLNAEDSKQYQLMFIEEALADALDKDFESYRGICSVGFVTFIENTKREDLLEMLQSEIGVTIKGRASEDFDKYKALPRLKYSIPATLEGDFGFLHLIYNYYQQRLNSLGQFDSDDISITALKQLDTPIWRRRRTNEGYDIVFIDETHLFNLNELSVFHHLTKDINKNKIIFAVDKSQAIGDKWLSNEDIFDYVGNTSVRNENKSSLNTIFRSSPEIINLAFEILSSGTSLFTTFENPLEKTISSFTSNEEKLCFQPKYLLLSSDEEIIEHSFIEAESLCKEFDVKRSEILLIGSSLYFTDRMAQFAKRKNKPIEIIKSRGDSEIVNKASKDNKFIISGIDYIGGLEFSYVIIVGVDKGRVPPVSLKDSVESFNFLNYAWHNRLYVAISRAKYSIIIIGNKGRGTSSIFDKAIKKNCISLINM